MNEAFRSFLGHRRGAPNGLELLVDPKPPPPAPPPPPEKGLGFDFTKPPPTPNTATATDVMRDMTVAFSRDADYATSTITATVATSMIVDCDITIDQNGENKLHKASNNEFTIINKYNPSLYCWSSLPHHPNPAMGDTSVLPPHLAELVTDQLHLPSNPDTSKMYLFKVNTVQDDDSTTFVNVIYYTSSTADTLTASDAGTHTTTIFDIRSLLSSHGQSQSDVSGGGNVALASGQYIELGYGYMTGYGRDTMQFDNGDGTTSSSNVPYIRNAQLSNTMEEPLSHFLSDVSHIVNHCLPSELQRQSLPYGSCPVDWQSTYQYPRLRSDAPRLSIHQVALRSTGSSGDNDDDMRALYATSNLHIDKCDGGGMLGSCTVHTCHEVESLSSTTEEERIQYLLKHRGLVVFPNEKGGRGVWIHSMVPGWNCAILFRTNKCLHGSVVLPKEDIQGFALKHLSMYRVVTYPLSRIETLLNRIGTDSRKREELISKSDDETKNRLRVN